MRQAESKDSEPEAFQGCGILIQMMMRTWDRCMKMVLGNQMMLFKKGVLENFSHLFFFFNRVSMVHMNHFTVYNQLILLSKNGYNDYQFIIFLFPILSSNSSTGSHYLFDFYLYQQKYKQFCKL